MNPISKLFSTIRRKYRNKVVKPRELKKLRIDILDYYSSPESFENDEDLKEALMFLKEKGLHYFPHPFAEKYNADNVEVLTDEESGMNYVIHNGHRLYFKRGIRIRRIQQMYIFLLCEQDIKSPHCYQTDSFGVEEGDILFDVGAAEGNFSLSVIDQVSKIYLFETDENWMEALQKTFEPWKDKVHIFNKFVSNEDSENTIKIDTITKELSSDDSIFLKLDVEGAEKMVLEGAQETLADFKTKAVICTYHNQDDYELLSNIMQESGFKAEASDGYMLFLNDELIPPYFRRGLIRCRK